MLDAEKIIRDAANKQANNVFNGAKLKLPNTIQTILLNVLFIVILFGGYVLKPVALNIKNPNIYLFAGFMVVMFAVINFHFFVKKIKAVVTIILILFFAIFSTWAFFSVQTWPIWDNGNQYLHQIGKVTKLTNNDSKKFEFDLNKNYVVNKEMALKIADKKMGVGSLSSQYKIGDATLQKIKYQGTQKLFWVINLEYNSFWTQFTNQNIHNVILVDANKPQNSAILLSKNAKNQNLNIRLSKDGILDQNLDRMAQLRNPFYMLTDFSFELDDDLNPHYVATHYVNKRGFAIRSVSGIVDINLQNNKIKVYDKSNVPSWVDRVNPISLVQEQMNNNGQFVHGIFNFSNKDKFTLSDENENYIYLDNEPFFISGITSLNQDSSLVGILAKSLKQDKTYKITIDGAVESSAMKSAEGKVQNYGYKAISPIIVFNKGHWKYLVPLVDNENLIKTFALVDIQNYQNVELFDNIDQFVSQESDTKVISDNKSTSKSLKEILNEKIKIMREQLDEMDKQVSSLK